eukprot:3757764-Prymnesium_polylepis.1
MPSADSSDRRSTSRTRGPTRRPSAPASVASIGAWRRRKSIVRSGRSPGGRAQRSAGGGSRSESRGGIRRHKGTVATTATAHMRATSAANAASFVVGWRPTSTAASAVGLTAAARA